MAKISFYAAARAAAGTSTTEVEAANRVEKEGIVTRGNGAATKGTKARGPMA